MSQIEESPDRVSRRRFLEASLVGAGGLLLAGASGPALRAEAALGQSTVSLPEGTAPMPVPLPHFPDRLHAFVWRNWQLVPVERLAQVVSARPGDILRLGSSMGLPPPPRVTADQQRRSYITVLRRNWHLLPYEQLLELLGWPAEQLAYTLRHDDGVFWKFGSLKPRCEPLKYAPPDAATRQRAAAVARIVREEFPGGVGAMPDPLFGFVADLSRAPGLGSSAANPNGSVMPALKPSAFSPRFCHSYFAPFGDPLRDGAADPYPDGYLARLAETGVDGVWLHIVLSKLAPFPWDPQQSEHYEERLRNLRALVARARRHGIGVYLYLNEPRTQPLAFFESRPELRGIEASNAWEAGTATLCTSAPPVQKYLVEAVATIGRAVPDLAGFFTITASEALTNCWSHGSGARCPRCSLRQPAEVIAELNGLYREGLRASGSNARLIVWDWGWQDAWAEGIIERLPAEAAFMSVSEWSIPIERGGVKTVVGEYSMSVVGPGPRATKHWALARKRGLQTIAKIQAGNTWELSAVPYIPAVANVAQHAANLRAADVDGVMLGWSLGGYPSPNLEVVAEMGGLDAPTPDAALLRVAQRRYGPDLAAAVVQAWREFSIAFSQIPFGDGLYNTPVQGGPSNLMWAEPTHYASGPVAFPYDDLDGWRAPYPPEVFIGQFEKVADGFEAALIKLNAAAQHEKPSPAFRGELNVAEAAAIHFRSTANLARFVVARSARDTAAMGHVLKSELALARRLYEIQTHDSRIGFEASNQYYYVPLDLVEKVINCRDLLARGASAVLDGG